MVNIIGDPNELKVDIVLVCPRCCKNELQRLYGPREKRKDMANYQCVNCWRRFFIMETE